MCVCVCVCGYVVFVCLLLIGCRLFCLFLFIFVFYIFPISYCLFIASSIYFLFAIVFCIAFSAMSSVFSFPCFSRCTVFCMVSGPFWKVVSDWLYIYMILYGSNWEQETTKLFDESVGHLGETFAKVPFQP